MNPALTPGIGKRFESVSLQFRGFFHEGSFHDAGSVPVSTILMTALSWILAVIPMRFGYPLSAISFVSGYVAIFLTAVMAIKAVGLESSLSHAGEVPRVVGVRPAPCPTCAIFGEFTGNFSDVPSKVEAIYIEHLVREHEVGP